MERGLRRLRVALGRRDRRVRKLCGRDRGSCAMGAWGGPDWATCVEVVEPPCDTGISVNAAVAAAPASSRLYAGPGAVLACPPAGVLDGASELGVFSSWRAPRESSRLLVGHGELQGQGGPS